MGNPALAMSVGVPPGPQPTNGAFLFYGSTDTEICYGSQYQFMGTQFSPFLTVQDNDYPDHGPAYYFEHLYDKIVVLPEDAFPMPTGSSSSKQKRQWTLPPGWGQQKQVVNPGEKPWFCVWNNTLIETFIYVQLPIPSNFTDATPSSSYPSPTTPANSSAILTTTPIVAVSDANPSTSTTTAPSTTSGMPLTGSFTMTIANPTTTTTVTAPSSVLSHAGYPPWSHAPSGSDNDDDDDDDDSTHKSKAKRWHKIRQSDMYDTLQLYPYIVKIEERRLANNPVTPYCQQYQILNNGEYNWVADSSGNAIIITLDEQDPSYSAYVSAGVAGSNTDKMKSRRQIPNSCHCQWWSGQ